MSDAHGRRNANPRRRRATPPGPSDAAPVRDAGRNGRGAIRTTMRPPTTNAVAITATPWSERRHEDRQRQGRDDDERQVVGAPDEGEAEPSPDRLDQPGHERQRGR